MKLRVVFFILASISVALSAPQNDPSFAPITEDPALPRVLILGDSISMAYTMPVRDQLKGIANVCRPPLNCGSSAIAVRDLDQWLAGFANRKWDVIHFNFGMRDLAYVFKDGSIKNASGYATAGTGTPCVPLREYEENLSKLVDRLQATGAKLIWATTTPVPATVKNYVKDAQIPYNEASLKVMREKGVAVDDLCAFANQKLVLGADPHINAKNGLILAEQVAQVIKATLASRAPQKQPGANIQP